MYRPSSLRELQLLFLPFSCTMHQGKLQKQASLDAFYSVNTSLIWRYRFSIALYFSYRARESAFACLKSISAYCGKVRLSEA